VAKYLLLWFFFFPPGFFFPFLFLSTAPGLPPPVPVCSFGSRTLPVVFSFFLRFSSPPATISSSCAQNDFFFYYPSVAWIFVNYPFVRCPSRRTPVFGFSLFHPSFIFFLSVFYVWSHFDFPRLVSLVSFPLRAEDVAVYSRRHPLVLSPLLLYSVVSF